jgi:hypothetical protein
VSLPAVTSMGTYEFRDCTALTSVSLPATTSINDGAFQGCVALTTVRLGAVPPIYLGIRVFRDTKGTIAPSRSIIIEWPTGAGVQSAYTAWLSANNSKWGTNLPAGGIRLATSGYTP